MCKCVYFTLLFLCMMAFSDERPNILLIVSEDNGPELSCYGEPYVKTPVLDQLANEGTLFKRAYVPQAGCSQSRAAFLTGLYPHQNGQIGLATWKFRMYNKETPNIVKSLKEAGYRTGLIGKLHVKPEEAFPFDFKAIPSSNFARKNQSDYAKEAAKFFQENDKPFFLSVNYPDAHRPFTPQVDGIPKIPLSGADVKPLAFMGIDSPQLRQETADYYNCMMRLDSLIGDLLNELKKSGKYENTVIAYIGDHGADIIRGKRTCFEGGLKIPMIIKMPNGVKQKRSELVSSLDLVPTFLELAKAEKIEGLPGNSLVSILKGNKPNWRKYIFGEFHLHSNHNYFPLRSICTDRYKLIENLQPGKVDPGHKFTIKKFFENSYESMISSAPDLVQKAYSDMHKPPRFQLFDLQNDPYEFNNVAEKEEYLEVLKELLTELNKWRKETNDPLLNSKNISKLQKEIDQTFDGKNYNKKLIKKWQYPEYFFEDNE